MAVKSDSNTEQIQRSRKQTHVCNTSDAISPKSPIFHRHSSSSHMDCLCLILQAKQGLIHLNKRAVQPAVAVLRTGSEE